MTATPTITAIIPAFNAQHTLQRTVASILAQTWSNFEVIIVDDGSEDDTLQIAQSITDQRVRVISQTNSGPGAARNAGLQQAHGRWVAFLDSDDTWVPDFFEHALTSLAEYPDVLFYFGTTQDASPANKISPNDVNRTELFEVNKQATGKRLRKQVEMSLCMMLADREAVLSLGGYYDKNHCTYGEDSYLCFLVFWLHPVLRTTKVVHTYYQADTGLSQSRHHHVQVRPMVADCEHLLTSVPATSRDQVRKYIAYLAAIDACRLAKIGQAAQGRKLISEKGVLGIAYQPTVCRYLLKFAWFSVWK